MMNVTIKNTGLETIDVPISSLIPGAQATSSLLGPDAEVEVVFTVPPTNGDVATAVSAWAAANGFTVTMSFTPFIITPPEPTPQPPPPPPGDPLGIG